MPLKSIKVHPSLYVDSLSLPFSTDINSLVLLANIAESFTIPAGANHVLFKGTGDFYVSANATATVPVDNQAGTSAELNPSIRALTGVTSLSVISAAGITVTAAFYV